MRLTSDVLTSALALLLVLAGVLLLPLVEADNSDIEVGISVITEQEADERDNPPSSGGNGGPSSPPPTPPAIPETDEPLPIPETPHPTGPFKLIEYTPKIIPAHKTTSLVIYGTYFPPQHRLIIESGNTFWSTEATDADIQIVAHREQYTEAIEYIVPARTLSVGEARLSIVAEDQTIISDQPLLIHSHTNPPNLRARVSSTFINVALDSETDGLVTVSFTNVGLTDWDYLLQPLHIGTDQPRDRQSRFFHPDWIYSNRPARVGLPDTGMIETGDSFTMTFSVHAPKVTRTTRYTERFSLVAEGLAWIPRSNFTVRFTVNPVRPATSTVNPTTQPPTQPQPTSATPSPTPKPTVKPPVAPYQIPSGIPPAAVKAEPAPPTIFAKIQNLLGRIWTSIFRPWR